METINETVSSVKFESSSVDSSFKNNASYKRQISFNSTPEVHNLINETVFNRQNSAHDKPVVVDYKDNTLKRQFSNQSTNSVTVYDAEKQSQHNGKRTNNTLCCVITISVFSWITSLTAIILVTCLWSVAKGGYKEHVDPYPLAQLHTEPSTSSLTDSGTFKLNAKHLKEYGKIRWMTYGNSSIIPQDDYGCLLVKMGGKYLVVSRFTFNLPADFNTTASFHSFTLLDNVGKIKKGGFRRIYVDAKQGQKTPSVFIELFELAPEEQICVNVTQPDHLYESTMDNDVNLVKV